jgi:hypothetical protein
MPVRPAIDPRPDADPDRGIVASLVSHHRHDGVDRPLSDISHGGAAAIMPPPA